MTGQQLRSEFPLDTENLDIYVTFISQMKEVTNKLIARENYPPLPEQSMAELCQIAFYVSIDFEKTIPIQYQSGIDMVKKHFSRQIEVLRNFSTKVAQDSINRGVPMESIIIYLLMYYAHAHYAVFPKQSLITGPTL